MCIQSKPNFIEGYKILAIYYNMQDFSFHSIIVVKNEKFSFAGHLFYHLFFCRKFKKENYCSIIFNSLLMF